MSKPSEIYTYLEKYSMTKNLQAFAEKNLDVYVRADVFEAGKKLKELKHWKYARKMQLVALYEEFFLSKEKFLLYYNSVDKNIKDLIFHLVWENSIKLKEVFDKFQFKVDLVDRDYYSIPELEFDPRFNFVELNKGSSQQQFFGRRVNINTFEIYIPAPIQNAIKKYIDQPKQYNLEALDEISAQLHNAEFAINFEKETLDNLELYFEYIFNLKSIDLSELEFKFLQIEKVKMFEFCRITEFFPDRRDFKFVRTDFLGQLLLHFKKESEHFKTLKKGTAIEKLRKLLTDFLAGKLVYSAHKILFPHIKRSSSYGWGADEEMYKFQNLLSKIFTKQGKRDWYSLDSIIEFINYRGIDALVYEKSYIQNSCYINVIKKTGSHSYDDKQFLNTNADIKDIFLRTSLGSVFFLLAAFGCVEIKFNSPKFTNYMLKGDKDYLSPFDSLVAVRITDFGKYVLGIDKKPKFEIAKKDNVEIKLSTKMLIATMEGNDPIKKLSLIKIGTEIYPNKFIVNSNSVLSHCTSVKDIAEKIDKFKLSVGRVDLPENWTKFFDELLKKQGVVKLERNLIAFSISGDKLVEAFKSDEVLSRLVLKAENFNIIVDKKKLKQVNDRLLELGFFVSGF